MNRTHANGASPRPDPHATVLALLRSAVDHARAASANLDARDTEGCHREVESTLEVIDALHAGLDTAAGGDLAERLEYLYGYSALRLIQGSEQDKPEALREAASLLAVIASGWQDMPRQARAA